MLKAMSDFLAAQKTLSVGFDTVFEVVTPTDQKLGLASSGTVTLARPDMIRVTRSGGFADFEILYDGKALTFLGKNANLYTQVDAPGTVDQLIDTLQNKYNRPLPGADLLMTNSYDELMQDVYDSKDLGSGVINGVECDSGYVATAEARVGRPLTPVSVAGVARRTTRRCATGVYNC